MVPNVARCQELRRTQMRRSPRLLSQDWRVGWCDPSFLEWRWMKNCEMDRLCMLTSVLYSSLFIFILYHSWSSKDESSFHRWVRVYRMIMNHLWPGSNRQLTNMFNKTSLYKDCTVPGASEDTNAKEAQAAEPGLEGSMSRVRSSINSGFVMICEIPTESHSFIRLPGLEQGGNNAGKAEHPQPPADG